MSHSTDIKLIQLGLGWIGDKPGGLETYQHGLCSELVNLGVSLDAWVTSDQPVEQPPSYPLTVFARRSDSRNAKRRSLTQQFTPPLDDGQVLVSHHAAHAIQLLKLAKRSPHVVHFHGPWADESKVAGDPNWKTLLKHRDERRVYQSADRLITLSQAFRKILIERYYVAPDRIDVVPGGIPTDDYDPGIDRDEARRRLGWSLGSPTLVCVRRLTRRMGLDNLVEAMSQIVAEFPEATLYIGGKGPQSEPLKKQIETLGLGGRVKLLGFVPDAELPLIYAAADLSVVPTRALEGFGLVCLESLAAGTPVLVTPVGGLPEVVRGLDRGLVLKGNQTSSLVAGIRKALSNLDALPDAECCKRYVRENFDWSVIAPRILNVYENARREHAQTMAQR